MKNEFGDCLANRLILNQADSELGIVKQLVSEFRLRRIKNTSIVLVPHKNKLEVEYALRSVRKPIGVAQYSLSKKLPKELLGKLPSAEDFSQILISGEGNEL